MVETLKEFGPYGFSLLIIAGAFVFVLRRKDPVVELLRGFLETNVKSGEKRDEHLNKISVDIAALKERGCKYERPR